MIIAVWWEEITMNCSCMESNYTSSLLVTVALEMSELIGVAGKCEVCLPPPLSPPPPPPPPHH